ncbi:MAG TPA: hypothetical protein VNV85_16920 [Puia sp.]|jgi:hypothetical protein|nr:hypothetical protein [Puia sp.]
MKLFITLTLAIMCHSTFASTGNPAMRTFSKTFIALLKQFNPSLNSPRSAAKVCACQILRVESNNEQQQYIAIFAQQTNTGHLSSDFGVAASILQREKKHLQNLFFTRVKVKENLNAESECSLLYRNIKGKYDNLKMYGILDADALSQVKNLNN